jgi:hypothetical protein
MKPMAVSWPDVAGRLLILAGCFALSACAPAEGGPGVYSPPPESAALPPRFLPEFGRGHGGHHGGGGPSGRGPAPRPFNRPVITQNAYELLLKPDGEHCDPGQSCYAIYTYVIFPRITGDDTSGTDAEVRKRYESLLHAILALSHAAAELAAAGAPKDQTNIFLIPAVHPTANSSLDNYNWQLALQYLVSTEEIISRAPEHNDRWRKFAQEIAMEPGPFLVSTPVPMNQLGENSAVLIADLSKYQAGAMEQFVAEYEKRIASDSSNADAVVLFNPLKVRLLSAAEFANASIEVELVALAKLPHGG